MTVPAKMTAIAIEGGKGPASALHPAQIDTPSPKEGEILVAVRAARHAMLSVEEETLGRETRFAETDASVVMIKDGVAGSYGHSHVVKFRVVSVPQGYWPEVREIDVLRFGAGDVCAA